MGSALPEDQAACPAELPFATLTELRGAEMPMRDAKAFADKLWRPFFEEGMDVQLLRAIRAAD